MNRRVITVLLLVGGITSQQARAQLNITNLDTGAGLYSANNEPLTTLTDPNWTVSLVSSVGEPPGGYPTGTTYLVPNQGINIGDAPYPTFPFNSWVANNGTSCWITYADPQNPDGWFTGPDATLGVYDYRLIFNAPSGGTINVATWWSDNEGALYLNGTLEGQSPSYSYAVPTMAMGLVLNAGVNEVDLIVTNDFGYDQDPSGANVEFFGNVNVVPEPSSVALVCLGLAGFLIFRRRKT
jgi:PEP-CTERM motif-containing protein